MKKTSEVSMADKRSLDLKGIFPPVTTPYDARGNLDLKSFAANLRRYLAFNFRGILVLGSSGEFVYLTRQEKLRLMETARKAISGDRLLIAGTGGESYRETLELTREAAAIGVDAALIITPHYYSRSMTPKIVEQFYLDLADESPVPLVIYSIPQNTHLTIDVDVIARLSAHPRIMGMKDSSGNLIYLSNLLRSVQDRFQILTGAGQVVFSALSLGAAGAILAVACAAPREVIELYETFCAGDYKSARRMQLLLLKLANAVTTEFGLAGLKHAVSLAGFHGGPPRLPLQSLAPSDQKRIEAIFREMQRRWPVSK